MQHTHSSNTQHLTVDGGQTFVVRLQALVLVHKVVMVMQDKLIPKVSKLMKAMQQQSALWLLW